MHEALYYRKLKGNTVQCQLCPHFCTIKENDVGKCLVRKNSCGKLYSLVYAKPCAIAIDPIEKKPQHHFYPGTLAFSIGTAGCQLRCKYCQNWEMARGKPEDLPSYPLKPEDVVKKAIQGGCKSIAYTYNDPTVFYEYVLDTAKLARKAGVKNVIVTNGFINPEPLKEWCKYIDAAHIDLKGFTEKAYKDFCGGLLQPVLGTLKILKEKKVWFEIICLLVPKVNDNLNDIKRMCAWIKENLGKDAVLHFSRFFPDCDMLDSEPTPIGTLEKAKEIAEEAGLRYVYIGNVREEENTYCPKCKKLIIRRIGYSVVANKLKNSTCPYCKEKIAGVFE